MILAIYTHKYGSDYYLLRDDQEVDRVRKEIAGEYWEGNDPWTGSPEQVDEYWQDKSDIHTALEWFESVPLTYHYEKPSFSNWVAMGYSSFIIVLGNIGDELSFVGPFASFEDAEASSDFRKADRAAVILQLAPPLLDAD